MKPSIRICPFCGQTMRFCVTFPGIDLAPGPLEMLRTLWTFRERTVPFDSLRDKKKVAEQFAYRIRMALQTADLPWALENDREVGYRLHKMQGPDALQSV